MKKTAKTTRKSSKSSAAKSKLAARGKKIMAEAKRIRNANPRKKWTSCVSEAGRKVKKACNK